MPRSPRLGRKGSDRASKLCLEALVFVPAKLFVRNKQPGAFKGESAMQGGPEQAAAPQNPGDRHLRGAGRVGRELTTYRGLPMTMPIVTAMYSAITPRAVRMQPEKNATTVTVEAQPWTGI